MAIEQPPIVVRIPYVDPEEAIAACLRARKALEDHGMADEDINSVIEDLGHFFKMAVTYSADEWVEGAELADKWERDKHALDRAKASVTLQLVED